MAVTENHSAFGGKPVTPAIGTPFVIVRLTNLSSSTAN